MDVALTMMNKYLHNIKSEGIPISTIEYLYIHGYLTRDELDKCLIDSDYFPQLCRVEENDLLSAIEGKCSREEEIDAIRLDRYNKEQELSMYRDLFE